MEARETETEPIGVGATGSQSPEEQARALLNEHVRVQLIHTFGARQFDVWLGKDGVVRYSAEEVAREVVESLWSVLGTSEVAEAVHRLHQEGVIAPPIQEPDVW